MLKPRQLKTQVTQRLTLLGLSRPVFTVLLFTVSLFTVSLFTVPVVAQENAPQNSTVDDTVDETAKQSVTSTEMLGHLLRQIEDGTVTNLVDVSALIRSGDLLEGTTMEENPPSSENRPGTLPAARPLPGLDRRVPALPRGLPGGNAADRIPRANDSRAFLPKAVASPQALYDNLGWTGASTATAGVGAGTARQKILELVETATSNRFEIDFNRLQPGTIITNIPITLTEPGFYYLVGDLTNTTNNGDGITIETDNVTIDLMGYNLVGGKFSGVNSDDGIWVRTSYTNIRIHNGGIRGWNGDGINALSADHLIFSDLHVRSNDGDGVVGDFNTLMVRVNAYSNGFDGIEADDGSVFFQCTAGQNGDNGIQMSAGSAAINCASFDNGTDGFDLFTSSVVDSCVATDNTVFGFDIALGGGVVNSSAYDNKSNGFDMSSACILRSSIAGLNDGHGIRTFANAWIIDNVSHENDLDGIRISSTDAHVIGNHLTDNDNGGIVVTSSGNLIVKNTMTGNVTNFLITNASTYGPFVNVEADDDISTVTNADHPWANLIF